MNKLKIECQLQSKRAKEFAGVIDFLGGSLKKLQDSVEEHNQFRMQAERIQNDLGTDSKAVAESIQCLTRTQIKLKAEVRDLLAH